MTINVINSDIGSATIGIIVSEVLPIKRKITATTKPKAMTSVNLTSSTDSPIFIDRSYILMISIDAGIWSLKTGRRLSIFLESSIAFAPAARVIATTTVPSVGSPHPRFQKEALKLSFSSLSIQSAISFKKIGVPFLYATIKFKYSLALFSCPFGFIDNVLSPLFISPAARETVPPFTASLTSSIVMPLLYNFSLFTNIFTALLSPYTLASDTPFIVLMRCAISSFA